MTVRISLCTSPAFDMAEAIKTTDFRGCALVTSNATFRQPVYYNDVIVLTTQVDRFGGKSFKMKHTFSKNQETAAEGEETRVWACTHPDDVNAIKAVAIPGYVKELLSQDKLIDTTA